MKHLLLNKFLSEKKAFAFILLLILVALSSCAPSDYDYNKESGFFAGLWHGFIIVFSLIGKLFGASIGIYAENNTGFTYWLGFIIGIGGFGGGVTRR